MSLSKFYIYVHRRADDNSLFYIGKGNKYRAWSKQGRSEWWNRIVNKHGLAVEIVVHQMTESDAFQLEKDLIDFYKEYVINLTAGGDGGGEWIDPARNSKHSEMMKQRWSSVEYRSKHDFHLKQLHSDPVHRRRISEMMRERHLDPEYTKRVGVAARKKHAKKVQRSDGVIFDSVIDAARAVGAKSHGNIGNAALGKRKNAYGYTWEYI